MTQDVEHFTVAVTERQLSAAAQAMIAAGRQWSTAMFKRDFTFRLLYLITAFFAWLLAIASTLLLWLRPDGRFESYLRAVGWLAFAVVLHAVGHERIAGFLERTSAAINRQVGGGLLGWRVRRIFAATIAKAPLTIQYEFSATEIHSTCRELNTDRRLRGDRIVFAHLLPDLLLVLGREKIRKRFYPIYLTDDRLRAAAERFLAANGITPVELRVE